MLSKEANNEVKATLKVRRKTNHPTILLTKLPMRGIIT